MNIEHPNQKEISSNNSNINQNLNNPHQNLNNSHNSSQINQSEENKKKLEQENIKRLENKLMNYFGNEFFERKLEIVPKRTPLENLYVSEDFDEILPNNKIFRTMKNIEKEIDEKIYKLRLNIQEELIQPINKIKAFLRTHIYAKLIKNDENETIFNLRIQGKILNILDYDNRNLTNYYRKFSHFFKKILIQFSHREYEDIEWNNDNLSNPIYNNNNNNISNNENNIIKKHTDYDGFEIKRHFNDTKDLNISIKFFINFPNPEFSLPNKLAELLGINQGSLPNILFHLWQYIKINTLQDNDYPNRIITNKQLYDIFKVDQIDITSLISKLNEFLIVPPPIIINFEIKNLNYNSKDNEILKDILITIEDPNFNSIFNFLSNNKEESLLFPKHIFPLNISNNRIDNYINALNEIDKNMTSFNNILNKHKYRYDFYKAYTKDPIRFINNFLIQQNELIKLIEDNANENRTDYTSSQYYKDYDEIVREYVEKYLERIKLQNNNNNNNVNNNNVNNNNININNNNINNNKIGGNNQNNINAK